MTTNFSGTQKSPVKPQLGKSGVSIFVITVIAIAMIISFGPKDGFAANNNHPQGDFLGNIFDSVGSFFSGLFGSHQVETPTKRHLRNNVSLLSPPKRNITFNQLENYNPSLKNLPPQNTEDIVNNRTQYSQVFDNGDGTLTLETHIAPIAYYNPVTGKYNEIDLDFVKDVNNSQFKLRNKDNTFDVQINERADMPTRIGKGNTAVQFTALGANPVNATFSGEGIKTSNVVTYVNAWNSTDLIYKNRWYGLKEEMILKDANAPRNFSFEVDATGVSGKQKGRNISFESADSKFLLNDVTAYDANLNPVKITRAMNFRNGKTYIDVTVDPANAVYPITIDPTTQVYASSGDGSLEADGSPTAWSTLVTQSTATNAYNGQTSFWIFADDRGGGTYYLSRLFFPFDTSVIGANNIVTSATLYLYHMDSMNSASGATEMVVNAWPASVSSLATTDFQYFGNQSGSSVAWSSITNNAYNAFAFNSTGLAWINTTGYTELGLRTDKDINNVAPVGRGYWTIAFSETAGTSNDPYLSVTFLNVTQISSCQTLNSNNMIYHLTQSVSYGSQYCFTISANNITLDCQGYTISGTVGYPNGKAIYLSGVYNGVSIQNCNIDIFQYGIYSSSGVNNLTIRNISMTESSPNWANIPDIYGLYLSSVNGSYVNNFTFSNMKSDNAPQFPVSLRGAYLISNTNSIFSNILVDNNELSATSTAPTFYGLLSVSGTNNTYVNITVSNNKGSNGTGGNGGDFYGVAFSNANAMNVSGVTVINNRAGTTLNAGSSGGTMLAVSVDTSPSSGGWNIYKNILIQNNAGGNTSGPGAAPGTFKGLVTATLNNTIISDVLMNNNYGAFALGAAYSGGQAYGFIFSSYTENTTFRNIKISNLYAGDCGCTYGASAFAFYVSSGFYRNLIYNMTLMNVYAGYGSTSSTDVHGITLLGGYNESYNSFINVTLINITRKNTGQSYKDGGIYISGAMALNNYFENSSNELAYNGGAQKFYGDSVQNVSSKRNIGWWPNINSDGHDATSAGATTWYNGTGGGSSTNYYWFNNQPLILIMNTTASMATSWKWGILDSDQALRSGNATNWTWRIYQNNSGRRIVNGTAKQWNWTTEKA